MRRSSAKNRLPCGVPVETDTSRPWRPTPLIVASAAVHAGALGYLVAEPSAWPLAIGTLVAEQLLLTGAGLWPRSTVLGSNWRRLPQHSVLRGDVAITIDDGPDPAITPHVLDILDRYNAKATFFCIGERALEHRDLCQEIARRGHAVENHSQHHLYRFALLGLGGIAREIRLSQETYYIPDWRKYKRETSWGDARHLPALQGRTTLPLIAILRTGSAKRS